MITIAFSSLRRETAWLRLGKYFALVDRIDALLDTYWENALEELDVTGNFVSGDFMPEFRNNWQSR